MQMLLHNIDKTASCKQWRRCAGQYVTQACCVSPWHGYHELVHSCSIGLHVPVMVWHLCCTSELSTSELRHCNDYKQLVGLFGSLLGRETQLYPVMANNTPTSTMTYAHTKV